METNDQKTNHQVLNELIGADEEVHGINFSCGCSYMTIRKDDHPTERYQDYCKEHKPPEVPTNG